MPPHGKALRLGAGGIWSTKGNNGPIRLLASWENGAELRLVADQAWHNNGEGMSLTISNDLEDSSPNKMTVTAEAGVTLTLRETVYFANRVDTVFGGALVVSDNSSFTLEPGVGFHATDLTLKGANAKLNFAGAFSKVADALVLADAAVFTGKETHLWDLDEPIRVVSGECRLEGTIVTSVNPFPVDIAEGATLTVTAAIVDANGLPVEIEKSGAGTLDNRVISVVDDVPAEPVVVNSATRSTSTGTD